MQEQSNTLVRREYRTDIWIYHILPKHYTLNKISDVKVSRILDCIAELSFYSVAGCMTAQASLCYIPERTDQPFTSGNVFFSVQFAHIVSCIFDDWTVNQL